MGHEPAPDAFAVVQSYSIAFDTLAGDTVSAPITYQSLGRIDGGVRFEPDTTTRRRTLKLIGGRYGWRILSPAINQHVSLDAVLGLSWLPDSLVNQLRATARRGA